MIFLSLTKISYKFLAEITSRRDNLKPDKFEQIHFPIDTILCLENSYVDNFLMWNFLIGQFLHRTITADNFSNNWLEEIVNNEFNCEELSRGIIIRRETVYSEESLGVEFSVEKLSGNKLCGRKLFLSGIVWRKFSG